MRFALVCAAALLFWAQRPALEARFIGNMAFAITDGQVTVMTDFPYQSITTTPRKRCRSAAKAA